MKKITIALLLLLSVTTVVASNFKVIKIASGLGVPWAISFLNSEQIIFTERSGRAGILHITSGKFKYLNGIPDILAEGQGGLLDVALTPNHKKGDWIYFTYSKNINDQGATTLARAHLEQNSLIDWTDLLVTKSITNTARHYGSRIAFDGDGHIFFSVGDRGNRPNGQNLSTHAGSILRLNLDGSIPDDNPFINNSSALNEIWSYGHRNPQGLAWDDTNRRLWSIEHGPRGGDEINLIGKGLNYGWPIISYGKEYWGPISVGEGTEREGMEQPVKYYIPSIAPGSLLYYSGAAFPEWRGDLFSGALKLQHINRITLDASGKATGEHRLIEKLSQRIRALSQSPEGYIYFSTDNGNVYRLQPN